MSRSYGLDLARSIAVLLAITNHSITAYNNGQHLRCTIADLLFRTSTATFVILFGVFLELVYARAVNRYGLRHVAHKLVSRAVQCYILYAISCLFLAAAEGYSLSYTIRMLVFLGATPYTDILKFYTVMLLIAPAVVKIRQVTGFKVLFLFCAAVHVSHACLGQFPYPSLFVGSEILYGFLYGRLLS
jgi:hypothetical protein